MSLATLNRIVREQTEFCNTKRERDAITAVPKVRKVPVRVERPKTIIGKYMDKVIELAKQREQITRSEILPLLRPLNKPYVRGGNGKTQRHDREDNIIYRMWSSGKLIKIATGIYRAP